MIPLSSPRTIEDPCRKGPCRDVLVWFLSLAIDFTERTVDETTHPGSAFVFDTPGGSGLRLLWFLGVFPKSFPLIRSHALLVSVFLGVSSRGFQAIYGVFSGFSSGLWSESFIGAVDLISAGF